MRRRDTDPPPAEYAPDTPRENHEAPHCPNCRDTHLESIEVSTSGDPADPNVHAAVADCHSCPRCASPNCDKYVSDMTTPYFAVVGSRAVYCCLDDECLTDWVQHDGPMFPQPDDEAEFILFAVMQIFRRYMRVGYPDGAVRNPIDDYGMASVARYAAARYERAAETLTDIEIARAYREQLSRSIGVKVES